MVDDAAHANETTKNCLTTTSSFLSMDLWEKFLKILEEELGKPAIDRWLRPLQIVEYDAQNLYLKAQDAFQVLWFEKEIRQVAKKRFLNERGRLIKIHIDAPDLPKQSNKEKPLEKSILTNALSFDCTFESFIVTEENNPFMQFLQQWKPENGNPLFLFGDSGVGKTHLLMALATHFSSQGKKVFFTHTETFTEHVVSAIRSGNVEPLRQTYRCVDVLLLDDVHCFARKGATQEEFFHTFNSLYNRGCPIILTSQHSPRYLKEIEPRLISRFEWGILFEIPPPSIDLLRKIMQKKIDALRLPLSSSILNELLKMFKNVKSALRALDALALRLPRRMLSPTIEKIKECLSDLIAEEATKAISLEKITQVVAEHFTIRLEDLLGKSQTKEITLARQIAIFLCRHELQLPFLSISRFFHRDHSTIIASVRVIEKKKSTDPIVARALFELKERIIVKS